MDIGPLATAKQLETVLRYIEIGKREAKLLCGGERLTGDAYDHGYYVSPAIFTDVTQDMRSRARRSSARARRSSK